MPLVCLQQSVERRPCLPASPCCCCAPQIQTLDIPGEVKAGYSPIGFVRCGRAACKITKINWKVSRHRGRQAGRTGTCSDGWRACGCEFIAAVKGGFTVASIHTKLGAGTFLSPHTHLTVSTLRLALRLFRCVRGLSVVQLLLAMRVLPCVLTAAPAQRMPCIGRPRLRWHTHAADWSALPPCPHTGRQGDWWQEAGGAPRPEGQRDG